MGINVGHLEQNEVHIWQTSLHSFPTDFPQNQLLQYLSDDERLRAERYIHHADRVRFRFARGILRVLLSGYLGINPGDIVFEYNPHGKPILAPTGLRPGLSFNVSHTGEQVAYIFAKNRHVGIDIERIRDNVDMDAIVRRFFSKAEIAAWERIAQEHQIAAFFNTWARKEAFIKALGAGLFYELQQFEVSVGPEEPAALLAIEGDKEKAQTWFLQAFTPQEGYAGAWVSEGQIARVQYQSVTGEMLCE